MRQRGTVKWFNDTKGFGFVLPYGGGPDIFVHFSAIRAASGERKTLRDGQIVEFEIDVTAKTGKSPSAMNVEPV